MPEANTNYVWVDTDEGLRDAVAAMSTASRIGVDTEADSRHHYPEKTCLIQVCVGESVYVIDPLAAIDVGQMKGPLEDPGIEKIFHGADFDLRGLNRDWGIVCQNVFDTNIAARFAGLERFGYAALIEDLVGRVIPKDQRLQRADWSKRPLSEAALQYASADVIYLGTVRDEIERRVRKLGRWEWVAEELERVEQVRYTPPDQETAYLSVKGSYKLDGKALGVLKALWTLREGEARRRDRPPAFVLSAEALIALSSNPTMDLSEVPTLGASVRQRLGSAIQAAIEEGIERGPLKRPRPERPFQPRMSNEQEDVLKNLKQWRVAEGTRLSLDPSLLWPMRSMERLAGKPQSVDEEMQSPDVRRWQRKLYESAIRRLLA